MCNATINASSFDLDKWQKGRLASFSESCFAEYWSGLPTIQKDQSIDPYDFHDRMALGKHLIENTGGEEVWGKDCTQHWFWGYLAQMDWQRRSGRFQDPSTWKSTEINKTETTISPKSWWGYMNLNFSVAVYFGAAEAGLVPPVTLSNKDVLQDKGFQQCVQHWKFFWSTYHKEFVENQSTDKRALVTLYQNLWKAHTDVIQSGVSNGKELEALLPDEDRNLGLGWCNMVELLAAMNWTLLSLDCLYEFGAGFLPSKRLEGPETVEWMKENRPREYKTIQNMNKLKDAPKETMEKMCNFWNRVTFWEYQRVTMPLTLDALSHGAGLEKILALSRIMVLAALPHSLTELGAWFGALSLVAVLIYKNKEVV